MNTEKVKLFNENNELVNNFDEEIEKILISVHGHDYFDVDEEIKIEKVLPTVSDNEKAKIIDNKKISIKDFIPVLFFMLIFAIILFAGYYFLNNFDFSRLINR